MFSSPKTLQYGECDPYFPPEASAEREQSVPIDALLCSRSLSHRRRFTSRALCTAPGLIVLLHIATSTFYTSDFILLQLLLVLQAPVIIGKFFGTGYVFQHIWKRHYHINDGFHSCVDKFIEGYLLIFFPGKLVTVKYLRLDRYHQRFPHAQDCTAPLRANAANANTNTNTTTSSQLHYRSSS